MFGRVQTAANWNFHLTIKIKKITWTHLRTTVSDWVNVRAKWNGSWIGHTTKLWPSILCKVLWYKIFILHNLIFIIDHQQHTSTLQNTKESFHQNWRKKGNIHHHNCPLLPWDILFPEMSDKLSWILNEWTINFTRLLPKTSGSA